MRLIWTIEKGQSIQLHSWIIDSLETVGECTPKNHFYLGMMAATELSPRKYQ
jgi:hypothetical protein